MKSKYWLVFTSILCLAMLAGACVSVPATRVVAAAPPADATPAASSSSDATPQPKIIQFAPGATSAIVAGNLPPGGMDRYVVAATAGQTMAVSVTAVAGQAILVVWGADGTVLISDHAAATNWSGQVPTTQGYIIDVKAGPDASAGYVLVVTIPPLVSGHGHTLELSETDANATVELIVGDMLAVMLEGNPTTGFVWETQSVDAAILRQLGDPEFRAESGAVGAGDKIALRFAAVAPGQTTLQLVYRRPFEQGVPPSKTFNATVVVKPAAAAPTPTTASQAAACGNVAQFVTDVTIPDGTILLPGQAFKKVWRVLNTGTCTWNANYQLVFVGGESMTPANVLPIPSTPLGATADLVVPMVSPDVSGPHVGRWEMRSDQGTVFGPLVDVRINVAGLQPPSSTCSGTPNISSFTASDTDIRRHRSVTLSWGSVTNADRVEIEPRIGGVATPGSIEIAPDDTTTFSLNAYCGDTVVAAQLTVNVEHQEQERLSSPTQAVILQPANGFVGLVDQTIRVVFEATGEAQLYTVELVVNGEKLNTVQASEPTRQLQGVFEWHPAPGSYQLWAVVRDDQGQENMSPAVSGVVYPSPSASPAPAEPTSLNGEWRAQQGKDTITLNLQDGGSCSETACPYGGTVGLAVNGQPVSAKIERGSFNGITLEFGARSDVEGLRTLTFVGTLGAGGSTITGVWAEQGGATGELVFYRQ
jgi:predicted secreted protein